jgi:hypothetical protein
MLDVGASATDSSVRLPDDVRDDRVGALDSRDAAPVTDVTASVDTVSETQVMSDAFTDVLPDVSSQADSAADAQTDAVSSMDALSEDGALADVAADAQTDAGSSTDAFPDVSSQADSAADAQTDAVSSMDALSEDGALADVAADAQTDAGSAVMFCSSVSGCAPDLVSCGGHCVSPTDSAHGCGMGDCTPCTLPHAVAKCAGACAIESCEPGFADCNHDPTDGCESDLSSPATCASCDVACGPPNTLCTPTGCAAACTPPETLCTDRCVNLLTDARHCGDCSASCNKVTLPAGSPQATVFATCSGGACNCACKATSPNGDNYCADTGHDFANCSACGQSCPAVTNGFSDCRVSTCESSCQPGWTLCGNACVTTQTDAANCGTCGHSCGLSEVCLAGSCALRSSIVLATSVATAPGLAVDQADVYWTDATDKVSRVPVGGGPIEPIWPAQAKPWGLALDDTFVYWSNQLGGAIWRGAKDGSGVAQLVATAIQPRDIALHQDNLYWIDSAGVNVWVAPKAGGSGSIAATPADGPYSGGLVHLIDTPQGPFTRSYSAAWFSYSVFGHWAGASVLGDSNGGMASDGVNLYYGQVVTGGLPSCQISGINMTTGAALGCFKGSINPAADLPLAAGGCGIFYAGPSRLGLARIGTTYGVGVLDTKVDQAVIGGEFLYIHSTSESMIGKIPLP